MFKRARAPEETLHGPQGDVPLGLLRAGECSLGAASPWAAPGAMGVEHSKPQQGNDVDVIDQDLRLPLSCLLIFHPSPVRCIF